MNLFFKEINIDGKSSFYCILSYFYDFICFIDIPFNNKKKNLHFVKLSNNN